MDSKFQEYPGRIISIGKDISGRHVIVAYAVTGRSPSSQARKILFDGTTAWVRPTDEQTLKQGNPDLLIYPAVVIESGIAVGNGKQTATLSESLFKEDDPVKALMSAHSAWEFEPDAPNFTPRISGCLKSSDKAALGIIKRSEGGEAVRQYFEFPLHAGESRMIATYTGENKNPLPAFQGEPFKWTSAAETAAEAAADLHGALAPDAPEKDFRVSVFCLFTGVDSLENIEIGIINRHEEKEERG